ncbi:Elicitin-like protein, partial [Globisporangium splendens]
MKTCSTLAFLGVVAATVSFSAVDAAACDMGAIQSKLFPNATEGLKTCAKQTGFDIWAIDTFPTEEQAQKIMTSRTCVDFLNQINQRANQEIQCDLTIQDTTKGFGSFIADILTGQTGNQTESDSGSDEIELPESSNGSKEKSILNTTPSKNTTTAPKSTTAAPSASTSTSVAASTTLSAMAAVVATAVSFALQW